MFQKKLLFTLFSVLIFTSCVNELPVSEGDVGVYFCHIRSCYAVFESYLNTSSSCRCALYDMNKELPCQDIIVDEDAKFKTKHVKKGTGLMHHKFCVVNESVVLTGSYNPSASDDDYNNLIVIHSTPLAQTYTQAYHNIISDTSSSSHRIKLIHNAFPIEAYFCPGLQCQEQLIEQLSSANSSILFALFTFTDPDVSSVLQEQSLKGVQVRGVVESWQSKKYEQYSSLDTAEVFLETSSRLQHNKVFVIDNSTVITGSYNPTKSAYSINYENIIIIHNPAIAELYSQMIEGIIKDTQTFK